MQLMQQLKRLFRIDARQGTSPQPISARPGPRPTAEDVERVVRRDFSANEYDTVVAILSEYERSGQPESARVQLAALKLADGSLQKLLASIELAKWDFRDALAAAEYPAYYKMARQFRTLPAEEQSRITNSDLQQYEEWFKR